MSYTINHLHILCRSGPLAALLTLSLTVIESIWLLASVFNVSGSYYCLIICEPNPVMESPTVSSGLQRRGTTKLLSDSGAHLTSVFFITLVNGVSLGHSMEHSPLVVFLVLSSISTLLWPTSLSLLFLPFTICHSYSSSCCVDHHFYHACRCYSSSMLTSSSKILSRVLNLISRESAPNLISSSLSNIMFNFLDTASPESSPMCIIPAPVITC